MGGRLAGLHRPGERIVIVGTAPRFSTIHASPEHRGIPGYPVTSHALASKMAQRSQKEYAIVDHVVGSTVYLRKCPEKIKHGKTGREFSSSLVARLTNKDVRDGTGFGKMCSFPLTKHFTGKPQAPQRAAAVCSPLVVCCRSEPCSRGLNGRCLNGVCFVHSQVRSSTSTA